MNRRCRINLTEHQQKKKNKTKPPMTSTRLILSQHTENLLQNTAFIAIYFTFIVLYKPADDSRAH